MNPRLPGILIRPILLALAVQLTPSGAALAQGAADSPPSHFYPSLINSNTGGAVQLSDFTPARQCRECHPTQYRHWSASLHAGAFRDPFFQEAWREASREAGPEMQRLCAGCHSPVGTLAEFVWIRDSGEIVADNIVYEGVTCDLCHTTVSVSMLRAGRITGNAGLLVDPGGPKRGPFADAFSTFHETAQSELHMGSDLCGACHNVFHPISHTRVARTHEEWSDSIYAENDIHCQDCHMVPPEMVPLVARDLKRPNLPGATSIFDTFRSPFYPHMFTGANAPISRILGNEDQAENSLTLLRLAASVRVTAAALDATADTLGIRVAVRNERAGHNLPTGMTEIRQMWLDVQVFDGDQPEPIWHSGRLADDGTLDPGAKQFRALAVDAEGNPTWKPWKVHTIVENTTIPPKRVSVAEYKVPVSNRKGPFMVKAALRYRSFSQRIADDYLGQQEGYRVPVVTMAADKYVVDR